jgi:glycosyltransferase involved in cell wall biosynthesis
MKSGVPVLGYVPNLLPHWINEDNGLWVNNKLQIVDFIADFLQNWLEDNIDQKLFDEMDKTVTSLQSEEDFKNKVIDTFDEYVKIRLESFESQLTKLQETE